MSHAKHRQHQGFQTSKHKITFKSQTRAVLQKELGGVPLLGPTVRVPGEHFGIIEGVADACVIHPQTANRQQYYIMVSHASAQNFWRQVLREPSA